MEQIVTFECELCTVFTLGDCSIVWEAGQHSIWFRFYSAYARDHTRCLHTMANAQRPSVWKEIMGTFYIGNTDGHGILPQIVFAHAIAAPSYYAHFIHSCRISILHGKKELEKDCNQCM